MEIIMRILGRFWPSGILFLGGLLVILYISLGVLYLQQGAQQREYQRQIDQLSGVISRPLASGEELRARYEEIERALVPISDREAIAILVAIAEENGIDPDTDAGKLRIPSATTTEVEMGGRYQALVFRGIYVQGDYDSVMAFISDLDSGKTMETMVLTRVNITDTKVRVAEDMARIAELEEVASAVRAMMSDNDLIEIPAPISFDSGIAVNFMGDNPDTTMAVEGFPDINTSPDEKGYTGTASPRSGYVLYGHDRTSTDNTSQYDTVNYIHELRTSYHYTCEADGTVRQFDAYDLSVATEHTSSQEFEDEIIAIIDVDIYTKP
jgi:hypothetical protein